MSFELDPATIAAMLKEARQCFLEEDAPKDLKTLQEGVKQRQNCTDFKSLLRAAHSLKGGAGIAQLSSLAELAHALEDVLQAVESQKIGNPNEGWTLLDWGVNEIAMLLNQARTVENVVADPNLLNALTQFTVSPPQPPEEKPRVAESSSLIQGMLEKDLEECFTRIEEVSTKTEIKAIKEGLAHFYQECLLLGETLDLPWLLQGIEPLGAMLATVDPLCVLAIAQELIVELRSQRDRYLISLTSSSGASLQTISEDAMSIELGEWPDEYEENWDEEFDCVIAASTQEEQPQNNQQLLSQSEDNKESSPELVEVEEDITFLSQLRIPLERLEKMNNNVEELLVVRERFRIQQQQLSQVTRQIRQIARQFGPIIDQVQTLYDQSAIAPISTISSPSNDFDTLELDGFTDLHSSLQTFQELMLKVQEKHSDLNLINQEFSENLEIIQTNVDDLYNNITESRLVPFGIVAQRFFPQVQYLNRRYGKSVELSIVGEQILIDQVILEQLQTPLTHLLNNAFDHGIEEPAKRLANEKLATATINLEAKTENNQLVLSLTDDGQGIDLHQVYLKARKLGLKFSDIPFEQLSQATIIDWIFQPGFSTSREVNALSGRGVGLDIVRSKIQNLRGTIQVTTQPNKGTTFIITIPLNLSLLPLFLVQCQEHTIAIPTASILENIPAAEIVWADKDLTTVNWHNQTLRVIPISELLSYPQPLTKLVSPEAGIVLESGSGPLMIMVDALLSEQKLMVKPFDDTVTTPPYLAGCTILGGGEIVPVILPQSLTLSTPSNYAAEKVVIPSINSTNKAKILVAEDSVATRRLLERTLTQVGFSVIVCRDGQDALDQLNRLSEEINLIISDIEMPRLNGFELLEIVRSNDNWEQIPFVMATSRTGNHHQQQAMKLGANAYVGKPILPNILLKTIEPLLKIPSNNAMTVSNVS